MKLRVKKQTQCSLFLCNWQATAEPVSGKRDSRTYPTMEGCCLYIEIIVELRSHMEIERLPRVSSVVPRLRPGHFKRSCGRGKAPPPCSRLRRARGSPTHNCGSGTGLPPVTQKKHQEAQRGRLRNNEHLSLHSLRISAWAIASLKIWCFNDRETAMKCCELLVVE